MKKIALGIIFLSVFVISGEQPVPPVEAQEAVEQPTEKPTFTKRLGYLGTGLAYSLVAVASCIAAFRCAQISIDRANADDPVKEWHDMYDDLGLPKEGAEWNERIKKAQLLKIFFRIASIAYGSLALSLPVLNVKYKIPHQAYENFTKAFQ